MSLEVTFLFSQCGISAVKPVSPGTLRFFGVMTDIIFIEDIITTNNSLVLTEIRG